MHSICHTVAMALSEASVKVVAIIFPLLLAACAETPSTGGAVDRSMQIYTERSALFGPEQSVPEPQQLFQLTPSQQAQFVEFYQQQKRSDSYSDDIIFDFLSQNLSRFDYHYDTYTAHEAWEKLQGNCLSLAILTQALADLIGVQAKYELVDATPVFEKQNDIVERGVHVRTKLFRPQEEMEEVIYSLSKGTVIDYFPGRNSRFLNNVSQSEFIAMYYNNIAAQKLVDGDVNAAYWYSLKSLAIAPNYAPHINTMAVIHRRAGDELQAEKIYRHGLTLPADQLVILKNYRALLALQQRTAEVASLDKAIAQLYDPNPYVWATLGDESYQAGELNKARQYYQKSISLAPYTQLGYLGLAKVWYAKGNYKKTELMLRKAMANSHQDAQVRRYQAKLNSLAQVAADGS